MSLLRNPTAALLLAAGLLHAVMTLASVGAPSLSLRLVPANPVATDVWAHDEHVAVSPDQAMPPLAVLILRSFDSMGIDLSADAR